MVERSELPRHLVGLVEGRVDGTGQPKPLGDCRQRRQHREGVRTTDHIQVVDLAVLFAQPQTLCKEQEVELAAFGRLGELRKRAELDVTAGRRVAPHRGVVDAGKVRR